LSPHTVAAHIQQLTARFGASSRQDLVCRMLQSSGENLRPDHLCHRSLTFAEGESPQTLWHDLLGGLVATLVTRQLGDIRFLTLVPRERCDEHTAWNHCLQPAEVALLKGLGSGQSLESLAPQFGISQSTAGQWSRNGLTKLGLGSRVELFRLLAPAL
jgi:DNA-binding CsgD family transcriptional regulator